MLGWQGCLRQEFRATLREQAEDSYEARGGRQQKDGAPGGRKGHGASLSLSPPPVMVVVKARPLPVARHSFHYNSLYINLRGDHTRV